MTTKEQLIREIEQAPDSLIEVVFGFLVAVKDRYSQDNIVQNAPAPKIDRPSKPIWEIAQELTQDMTVEEIAQLPKDGADQHDHYIYGIPKREE